MKNAIVLSVFLAGSTGAFAQGINVQVNLPLPTLRIEAPPPLVTVEPGVQVFPDYGAEVYFVDGFYWHRTGGHWYRCHDVRQGRWEYVEERVVPGRIVHYAPGRYVMWHERKELEKEERREDRREFREDRREAHEDRREDREEHREEEHGRGKGKGKKR